MPIFLTRVVVEKLNGVWRLLAPLEYDGSLRVTVPCGFRTDFASVPRVPFLFWFTGDTAHAAAVLHDFLYQARPVGITRARADALFAEAMQACGEPAWRRWLLWGGVRLGGRRAWATGPERFSDFRNALVCGPGLG